MSRRIKIVADMDIPFLKGVLDAFADIVFIKGADISPEDVRDADALLVRTRTRCDAALLDGSRVQFVGTATIGFDHIDMPYCREHGIEVAVAAGCNARGVLQYISAALAALSQKEGWMPGDKTVGVVGVGNVGSLVAQYCTNFGFKVLCCDPPKQNAGIDNEARPNSAPTQPYTAPPHLYIALDELLSLSDIVTLHVPLDREGKYKTLGMADDTFFGKMRKNAVFINSSRGEVAVDEAVVRALESGRLQAAVIDTWNREPHINRTLLGLAAFATPHIAGYSLQGKANGTAMVVNALGRHFGLPSIGWYPTGVARTIPNPGIAWTEMLQTIKRHFDIETETEALKRHPDRFERFRNGYNYREEYF